MTPLKLKLGRAVPDSPIPPLSTNAANSSKSYNSRQDWNTHWKIRGELKIDHDRMTRQAMHGRFSGVVWTLDQTWDLGPTLVLGCGVDTGPDLRPWLYVGSRVWCGHWTRSETLALRWFSGVVWALDQTWDLGPTLVLVCGVDTGPDLTPWLYIGSRVWFGHRTRPETLALRWFSGVVWALDQTWDLGPTLVLVCGVGTGPDLRPWPYVVITEAYIGVWTVVVCTPEFWTLTFIVSAIFKCILLTISIALSTAVVIVGWFKHSFGKFQRWQSYCVSLAYTQSCDL